MWSLTELFPKDLCIDIVDIGASLLEEVPPYTPLVESGQARITGFEPNLEECEKLIRTYGSPHRFFPYFIGDGEDATYYETNWVATGSLFEPNTPLLEIFQSLAELTVPTAEHPVPTTRLDDIPEIENVDLLKLDVQGAELSVLSHAHRALSSTLVIQTEVEFVELYKGQPLFGDVDTFMRKQGFQFHTFLYFGTRTFKPIIYQRNPSLGLKQFLWSDAIYVRDWMKLQDLSESKLCKYAILAHDFLGSYDLAYRVLLTLDLKTGSNLCTAYAKQLAQS